MSDAAAAGLRTYVVPTPAGPVRFHAETPEPDVLLIHGFKRFARHLLPWRARVPGLGFIDLPGHGGAPELAEVSLQAWIEGLRRVTGRLARPPVLIGESLGALVALSIPARAVVAVEPPLSTHQLWPLYRTFAAARARGIEIPPEQEALFAEPFHWVLEKIASPTLVIAGDVPLMPERPVFPEPSLLTDEDFAAYAANPHVQAVRIAGGHTLLDHNPDGVMAAAAPFLRAHGVTVP